MPAIKRLVPFKSRTQPIVDLVMEASSTRKFVAIPRSMQNYLNPTLRQTTLQLPQDLIHTQLTFRSSCRTPRLNACMHGSAKPAKISSSAFFHINPAKLTDPKPTKTVGA